MEGDVARVLDGVGEVDPKLSALQVMSLKHAKTLVDAHAAVPNWYIYSW